MPDAASQTVAPTTPGGFSATRHRAVRERHAGPSQSAGFWGLVVLAASLAPAPAAIWAVPWFVTQDTPAHVYNAEILSRSFDPASPFVAIFDIRWQAIPNWVGHLVLAGLVQVIPAWAADRIMTTVTLVGFAAAIFWLRLRVLGPGGRSRDVPSALLTALLAMNITWLFGFTSFALGACLLPVTLGYWWPRRDRLTPSGIAGLWMLLVLGYFCHLVSLGLTVLSLAVLAMASPYPAPDVLEPGREIRWRTVRARLVPLGVVLLPLIPLAFVYLGLTRGKGPMSPYWRHLTDPLSLAEWKSQLTWVDPISLSRKDGLPFTERVSPLFLVFAPAFWLALAMLVWGTSHVLGWLRGRRMGADPPERPAPWTAGGGRRGWWLLAAVLILGGLVSPDTLGAEHGNYLPQRVVLCGLVALAVVIDIDVRRPAGRLAAVGLAGAVALQSAVVWDFALYSDRTAGEILRAGAAVGRGHRVAYLPASVRSRFRANPLLHVDNWLGVRTDNIIWGNYETQHYYFPVRFRAGIDRPSTEELEKLKRLDGPADARRRARRWADLLAHNADAIDILVVYKTDPWLDAVSSRFFHEVQRRGDVRVLARDPLRPLSSNNVGPAG